MSNEDRLLILLDLTIWALNSIVRTRLPENSFGYRDTYQFVAYLETERDEIKQAGQDPST